MLLFFLLLSTVFSCDDCNDCNDDDCDDCCCCCPDDPEDVLMVNLNYYATRDYATAITSDNIHQLHLGWNVSLSGSSISPPSIIEDLVWTGDFGGSLTTVDYWNGDIVVQKNVSTAYNLPNRIFARVTPTHDFDSKLVITVTNGIIGQRLGQGVFVIAANRFTLEQVWKTQITDDPWAVGTGSPLIKDGFAYVVTSSAGTGGPLQPNYTCCTTTGRFYELDLTNGFVTQDVPMIPDAILGAGQYSGAAIWGQWIIVGKNAYVGTGQMYQVPAAVAACVLATPQANQSACIDPRVNWNSVVKIRLSRGRPGVGGIVKAFKTTGVDVWNVACYLNGLIPGCQLPGDAFDWDVSGLIYSEAQGIIYAATKAGFVIALDTDLNFLNKLAMINNTGSIFGGYIGAGALRDDDDPRNMRLVYANNNGNYSAIRLPNGTWVYSGVWVCYDGNLKLKWMTPAPGVGLTPQIPSKPAADTIFGGVTMTNDLVMGCTRYGGLCPWMHIDTGKILKTISIGGAMSGSCSGHGDSIICPTGPGGNPLGSLNPKLPGPVYTATSPPPGRTIMNIWNIQKWEI